jgi:hypothetical protein
MRTTSSRGRILEVSLFAIGSVLFTRLGLGALFFLIPLQIVRVRRGRGGLYLAVGIVLVLLAGCSIYDYSFSYGGTDAAAILAGFDFVETLLFILGLVIVNAGLLDRYRGLLRLLAATMTTALIAIPICLLAPRIPAFPAAMQQLFERLAGIFKDGVALAGPTVPESPVTQILTPSDLMSIFSVYAARCFLLSYFITLTLGWWGGTLIAARTVRFGQAHLPVPRLAGFHLDGYFVWALIGGGALILLDRIIYIPALSYPAWNLGLVVFFLYGLQGLAILKFLFEKYRLPRLLWALFLVLIAFALISTQAGIIVMIAIPAFGVSENWLRLRVPRGPEAED